MTSFSLSLSLTLQTEFVAEARSIHHEMELDLQTSGASVDDEYANIGSREPKICVTTSRDPSSRLKQFAKWVCRLSNDAGFLKTIFAGKWNCVSRIHSQSIAATIELMNWWKHAKSLTLQTLLLFMKREGCQMPWQFHTCLLAQQHFSLCPVASCGMTFLNAKQRLKSTRKLS